MENKLRLYLFYIIFAFSGFSGLIYESIWTHYLKLFLGHASYSQALVLIIFMGGMAIGAWGISKFNSKIKNPLFVYALIEGFIGVFAIFFHLVFTNSINFLYEYFLTMSSLFGIEFIKWGFSILIILPQSILLGMTFPLMTGGILRKYKNTGRIISTLYFSNSIGAVFGVLLSGLILIETYGLNKTIQFAGYLNISIMIFMLILSVDKEKLNFFNERNSENQTDNKFLFKLFLIVSGLTGLSSFIYEISWIRMLSMVLGSTSYAFELMLSSFILGIAVGGFWIRKRIEKFKNPVRTLGKVQISMGLLGISTVIFYNLSFNFMNAVILGTNKTRQGYAIHNFFQWFLSILTMLPTTFFAGMTLPLIIFIMISKNNGEKSIGQVYSSNTIGSIVGILLSIFILLPFMGLKYSLIFGGMIDVLLGFYLILYSESWKFKKIQKSFLIIIFVVVFISIFFSFDKFKMASGGFNGRGFHNSVTNEIIFHKDGETASVDILKKIMNGYNIFLVITNGKVDAGVSSNLKLRESDEKTMYLLGLAPEMLNKSEKIAVIGLGSGITSHMALSSKKLKKINTIEIEKAIVEGVKNIKKYNFRVFDDKRSKIYIEDAKTFFVKDKEKYNAIISEPSNPWISGVSSLFSKEYYSNIKKYLEKDGVLIQWVQQYFINLKLFASIIKGIRKSFRYCDLYFTLSADTMLIIGNTKEELNYNLLNKVAKSDLNSVKIKSSKDLYWKHIGSLESLYPYFNSLDIIANSDYFPVLNYGAIKAKFLGESIYRDFYNFIDYGIPIIKILENKQIDPYFNEEIVLDKEYVISFKVADAKKVYKYLVKNINSDFSDKRVINSLKKIKLIDINKIESDSKLLFDEYFMLSISINQFLPKEKSSEIWNKLLSKADNLSEDKFLYRWLLLFQAISAQNFENMVKYSENLIMKKKVLMSNNKYDNYLLASYILGNIKLKRYDKSLKYWDIYKYKKLPVLMKVLYEYNNYYLKKKN